MASIPEYFNIGETDTKDPEQMVRLLQQMYTDLAQAINQKPDLVVRETNGSTTETFLSNGTINVNTLTDTVEVLTSRNATGSAVVWTTIS
jgi:hypothetical protein